MKNKLLLFLVVIALVVLPNLVLADTSGSSTIDTIKANLNAKKEVIKNTVEERRQSAVGKIKEQVDQFIQNMIIRFEATNNRLIKIADRINSRMIKMEAKGIDVSEARILLTEARTKIDTATTSVTAILSVTSNLSPETTTATIKEEFKNIKIQIETAKEASKTVHAALVKVVNSLKPGDNKLKTNQN